MHAAIRDMATESAETGGTARCSVRLMEILGLLPVTACCVARRALLNGVVILYFTTFGEYDLSRIRP